MTLVVNLKTGDEFCYSLPPNQAVVGAFLQHSKKL